MNTGKMVIAAMFLAAVGAVGVSFWYHHQKSRRALAFLTPETARLVTQAPRVELLLLAPRATPAENAEVVLIEGEPHPIFERRDLSAAPGLVHARHALLEDDNYDWKSGDVAACTPEWTQALRFSTDEASATLVFAFNCERMSVADRDESIAIPRIAPALESFFTASDAKDH